MLSTFLLVALGVAIAQCAYRFADAVWAWWRKPVPSEVIETRNASPWDREQLKMTGQVDADIIAIAGNHLPAYGYELLDGNGGRVSWQPDAIGVHREICPNARDFNRGDAQLGGHGRPVELVVMLPSGAIIPAGILHKLFTHGGIGVVDTPLDRNRTRQTNTKRARVLDEKELVVTMMQEVRKV